jgi:hypothetical protein
MQRKKPKTNTINKISGKEPMQRGFIHGYEMAVNDNKEDLRQKSYRHLP